MEQTRDFFGTPIYVGNVVAFTDPESSRKSLISGVVTEIGRRLISIEIPNLWFNEDDEPSEENSEYVIIKKHADQVVSSPLNSK